MMPHLNHIQRQGEFVCGCGASFINILITFPVNKIMFRQQLYGISGMEAVKQLRKDGLRLLYRGLLPPLLQKSTSVSIMFGMYYRCQDFLKDKLPGVNVYAIRTLSAFSAGTIESILVPFERIQTLMQTRQYNKQFVNTLDAFYSLRKYGLFEYYRCLSLIICRNGFSNVAFFLGREYFHIHRPDCNTSGEKLLMDFISGACIGSVISTCVFPLNVIKIRMQCQLGSYTGIWPTLQTLLAERNGSFLGLYKGVHINYMRSFLSWGIINATYEFLMTIIMCN